MHRQPARLAISIVTYAPEKSLLKNTLASLSVAVDYALKRGILGDSQLFLIDNGPENVTIDWNELMTDARQRGDFVTTQVIQGHGNVGYGAGHNLAIYAADCEFHLVLNPDVVVEKDAIFQGLKYMMAHPEVGLLAPRVLDDKGCIQYLCKRYPSVLDLLLRGFAPQPLRTIFGRRLARYELRDVIGDSVIPDIPIASGCFMLLKYPVLRELRGFSADYFLYFEDFDISLRLAEIARTAYVPSVQIVHFGGHSARKGFRHIVMFLRSALTFFNQHGWKWL